MKRILFVLLACVLSVVAYAQSKGDKELNIGNECYEANKYTEALKHWEKSAEQGNAIASYNVGILYEHGLGVEQDKSEALRWYLKSAERGDASAQRAVGVMYCYGQGVATDYAVALNWFKRAESRDSYAQVYIGEMYRNGWGIEQNYAEAMKWYKKAADQGNSGGQLSLGLVYYFGWSVPKDDNEALNWWKKAASQGDVKAMNNIGYLYYNRSGAKNYTQAFEWIKKAADKGNAKAQYTLGVMYIHGHGTQKDYEKGISWIKKAVDAGEAESKGRACLFGIGMERDYKTAMQCLYKVLADGDFVHNFIGYIHENGLGVDPDVEEAIKWYKKGADGGNEDAQVELGRCYLLGKGVAPDKDEARKWLKKAAEAGLDVAQGLILEYGLDGKVDYQTALKCYQRAAAHNYWGGAQTHIGRMYENGLGVEKDYAEAKKWYEQAAELGDADAVFALARVSRGQGEKSKTSIKAFPVIDITDVQFADDGNNCIDAGELCAVKFKVSNTGKGTAHGCVAVVEVNGATGITTREVQLPLIAPGKTIAAQVEMTADGRIKDGKANLKVSVREPNGFDSDPMLLAVETKAFVAPKVLLADYSVTSGQGSALTKRTPFDLQVLVQNAAHGMADDVNVAISVPDGVFMLEGEEEVTFSHLAGGETQSMVYQLVVNNKFAGSVIPVRFTIKEKHGKYAESRTLNLSLNQPLAQNKVEVEVKSNAQSTKGDVSLAKIQGSTKQADIDSNIPTAVEKNKRTFAVVIANENYKREEAVKFASNDGRIMQQYLVQTLGLPENNVHVVSDATLNEMREELAWLKQLADVYEGDLNIILYYAGHGMPDEASGKAYLIPVDGNGQHVGSCLALSDVYKSLQEMKARRVSVFLDACFSGAQRGDGMLVAARGVAIKAKQDELSGNMVVFSAAQSDETAYPYTEMGHGLFTYFLLKKLQETKGEVTLGELGKYIATEVRQHSVVVNRKQQTPSTSASSGLSDEWKTWKLK